MNAAFLGVIVNKLISVCFICLKMVGGEGFEPPLKGLCIHTIVFTTLSVCGLDYAFTILQVGDYSLYTSLLRDFARRWDFKPFTEFTPYYYTVSRIATLIKSPLL